MKNKKEEEEEGRRKIKDRFEEVYIFVTRADWYSRMQCSLYLFKHFPAKMIEFTYLETSLLNNSGRCSISISTLTRANIRYTWGEVSWQALSRAPCTIATKITGVDFFFFFFISPILFLPSPLSSPFHHPFFRRWRDRSALEKRFRDEKFQYDLNSAADTSRYSRNGTCAS